MKRSLNLVRSLALLGVVVFSFTTLFAYADSSKIASYDSSVLGVKMHYMMIGGADPRWFCFTDMPRPRACGFRSCRCWRSALP